MLIIKSVSVLMPNNLFQEFRAQFSTFESVLVGNEVSQFMGLLTDRVRKVSETDSRQVEQ